MWPVPNGIVKVAGLLSILSLSACYHPLYNNFEPQSNRAATPIATGAGVGAVAGAVAGSSVGGAAIGAAIGGAAGGAYSVYKGSRGGLIRELEDKSIQFVEYGDMKTLVVPTDKYYLLGTPRLNERAFPGLRDIISLVKMYPDNTFYVAGFTDDIGSEHTQRMLTQSRAEAMVTFLWANGIRAELLHAQGYGEKHPIGNNQLIHGSAFNRRVEIQWYQDEPPKLAKRIRGWKK